MLFHWSLPWQVLSATSLRAVYSVWICFKCIAYWYAVKFMAFLGINITFFFRRNTAYSSNLIATFIWSNESTRSPSNVNDKKWKSIRIHCINAVACILDGHQDHWHRKYTHFRKRSEKFRSFRGESCWFRWMKALEQREVAVERESIICIQAWSEARMNFDRTRLWICALDCIECVRAYVCEMDTSNEMRNCIAMRDTMPNNVSKIFVDVLLFSFVNVNRQQWRNSWWYEYCSLFIFFSLCIAFAWLALPFLIRDSCVFGYLLLFFVCLFIGCSSIKLDRSTHCLTTADPDPDCTIQTNIRRQTAATSTSMDENRVFMQKFFSCFFSYAAPCCCSYTCSKYRVFQRVASKLRRCVTRNKSTMAWVFRGYWHRKY